MKNKNSIVVLGVPAIGALVCGISAFGINPGGWGWFSIGGWIAGHIVLNIPEISQPRVFASDVKTKQQITLLTPKEDGFTGRAVANIPFEQLRTIASVVVQCNSVNFTLGDVEMAFPRMAQNEQRQLHKKIVGLLNPEEIGIINSKANGHNEITIPEGRKWFARVANGMIMPLESKRIPYTPPPNKSVNVSYSTQHTRATRADFSQNGEVV